MTTFLSAEGANQRDDAHVRKFSAAWAFVTTNGTTPSGAFSSPPQSSVTTMGALQLEQRPATTDSCWALPQLRQLTSHAGSCATGTCGFPSYDKKSFLGLPAAGTAMSSRAWQ